MVSVKMIVMDIEVAVCGVIEAGMMNIHHNDNNHSELFENLKVYLLARWEVLA